MAKVMHCDNSHSSLKSASFFSSNGGSHFFSSGLGGVTVNATPISLHHVLAAFQASCAATWTSLKTFQSSSRFFEYSTMLALVVLSWASLSPASSKEL